jgi:hypothetical protein
MSATVHTHDDSDALGTLYRFRSQICMGREKPERMTPADEAAWEGIKREVTIAKQSGWVVDCPNNE